MAVDPWSEFVRLLTSGALVAAAVLPATLILFGVNRKLREPLVPHVRPWPVRWRGVDVALLVMFGVLLPMVVAEALSQANFFEIIYGIPFGTLPAENASAAAAGGAAASRVHEELAIRQIVKGLWGSLFALPIQIGAICFLRFALYPTWRPLPRISLRQLPARFVLAGVAWSLLTPAVFTIHLTVGYLSVQLGSPIDDHPLTKLGPDGIPIDRVLFVLQACLFAPIVEEWLCRGILLPWTIRRSYRTWIVLGSAISLAVLAGLAAENPINRHGAAAFLTGVLVLCGLAALKCPRGRAAVRGRRWGGVAASAALFAALHSTVWPTPVPLFVLGIGLGWLALATRGILVPVIVHGLFNAVSVLMVLRGT